MAKTISSLNIKIALSAEDLKKGSAKAQVYLNDFGTKAKQAGKTASTSAGGLASLAGKVKSFGAAFGPLGAAITGALALLGSLKAALGGVAAAFQRVDEAAKAARQLGTSIRSMEALGLAAERGGEDFNQVRTGLAKMLDSIGEAIKGTQAQKDAFDELGLSAEKLARMPTDEAFVEISKAITSAGSKADQVRLAMDIFGRSGRQLLVTMESLAASGMVPLREEMAALGALSQADAAKIEEMNDAWTETKKALQGVFNQVAASVAPVLEDLLRNVIVPLLKGVIALAKAFRLIFGGDRDEISGAGDEAKVKAEAASAAISDFAAKQKEAAAAAEELKKSEEAAAKAAEEIAKSAESFIDRYKTPVEQINEELAEFQKLWQAGLIPIETAKRAADDFADRMAEAKDEADGVGKSMSKIKTPTIGAVDINSTAGFNQVQALLQQGRDKAAEESRERREMLASSRRREELLRSIRDRLGDLKRKPPIETTMVTISG